MSSNDGALRAHKEPSDVTESAGTECGLTLRDYFAARCPESEIPKFVTGDAMAAFGRSSSCDVKRSDFQSLRCRARYAYADAMLATRKIGERA